MKGIGCLLIIVKHEMPTHGRYTAGKFEAQSPPGNVHLVDSLIAQVPIAGIPIPVPVIMKTIARERCQGSGTCPKVIINACWNRFLRSVSYRVAPLKAHAAGQIHFADGATVKPFDCLLDSGCGANLGAVLNDAVIF